MNDYLLTKRTILKLETYAYKLSQIQFYYMKMTTIEYRIIKAYIITLIIWVNVSKLLLLFKQLHKNYQL